MSTVKGAAALLNAMAGTYSVWFGCVASQALMLLMDFRRCPGAPLLVLATTLSALPVTRKLMGATLHADILVCSIIAATTA